MISPLDVLSLSVLVIVVHEMAHLVSSINRVKGVVVGIVEKWKIGVGFVVYPLKLRDVLLPQILVPATLILVYRDPLLIIIGILMNAGSGVHDLTLIPKLQRINGKTEEDVRREVSEKVRGIVWWIR
ncbi:MAG: hypothetical protein QXM08_00360 [Thermofilaceae archaeon]